MREQLFDESTELAAVPRCDRVDATRIPIAFVVRKRELGSSDHSPPLGGLSRNIDDEPDRARIAGSCSRRLDVLEFGFKPPAREAPEPAT
ncbi:MAG TPA: hypothetical protein VFU84_00145 [Gaiellaceae bacterium]|nr:hypothetical protein [Gaiellaceae bacterium]